MKTFMKKWKWKILILVYLCFIYGNSLTPAAISSKESGYFLAKIQDFLAGAGMDAWWLTEHLVRKAAHFTEYAGLGFLLAMNTGAGIAPVFCLLKGNVTAVLFMPFVDETIQLFVEGRSTMRKRLSEAFLPEIPLWRPPTRRPSLRTEAFFPPPA